MSTVFKMAWLLLCASLGNLAQAQSQTLVSAQWLKEQPTATVQLIDTRAAKAHAQARIPGAVNLDVLGMSFRGQDAGQAIPTLAKTAGLQASVTTVIYDQGADMNATSLYFELLQRGYPMDRVRILDGGFHAWQEVGGAAARGTATALVSPTQATDWQPGQARGQVVARLADVMTSATPGQAAMLVEALEPGYFYAAQGFFDRKGHIPNAKLMSHGDFFQADRRFKTPEAIRELFAHQGIAPADSVITYCGGGIAASVPWFAAYALLSQGQTKLYKASLMEYTRDDRQLPLWTYGDETLRRSPAFVSAWADPIFAARKQGQVRAIDVRSAAMFASRHLAQARSLPVETGTATASLAQWQARLRAVGVGAQHEVVILGEGGITPAVAWAWWLSRQAGQAKTSILWEGPDELALGAVELSKSNPGAAQPSAPAPESGPASAAPATAPAGVSQLIVTAANAKSLDAATHASAIQLPYQALLDDQRKPLPAAALWAAFEKAGVSRHLPIAVSAKDPADAAVLVYLLHLMGYASARLA